MQKWATSLCFKGLILSASVHCVARVWKNWRNIATATKSSHFWALLSTPLYQYGPNLAANSTPAVYANTPNFIWIRLLCHLSGTKRNFWQIWHFGSSCTQTPLLIRAKFGVPDHTRGTRSREKFRLDPFIVSPSDGEKSQTLPFFGLRHFMVSPVGGNLRKLKTCAQLQTFPYPTVSKSFLYSNAFMAKSGARSPTFKSVTDKQTDKQSINGKHRRGAAKPAACAKP